jgi:hypothetical protein
MDQELNIFSPIIIAFIRWRRTRRAGLREKRNAHKGKGEPG